MDLRAFTFAFRCTLTTASAIGTEDSTAYREEQCHYPGPGRYTASIAVDCDYHDTSLLMGKYHVVKSILLQKPPSDIAFGLNV